MISIFLYRFVIDFDKRERERNTPKKRENNITRIKTFKN